MYTRVEQDVENICKRALNFSKNRQYRSYTQTHTCTHTHAHAHTHTHAHAHVHAHAHAHAHTHRTLAIAEWSVSLESQTHCLSSAMLLLSLMS